MCDHGRSLDVRTVARAPQARGRHRPGGKRYKKGWADEGVGRRARRRPKSSRNFYRVRGILWSHLATEDKARQIRFVLPCTVYAL